MPKPEKHVFVCVQNRPAGHPRPSCGQKNCAEVAEEFYAQLQARQCFEKIQVTTSGCLGPCSEGPSVLVYPEGVMYAVLLMNALTPLIDRFCKLVPAGGSKNA